MHNQHSIPSTDEYLALQKNLKKFQSNIKLKNSPESIIRYSGQVDLMNKLAGNSSVKYEFINHPRGGTVNNGFARKCGMKIEYSELPYEWVWPWWTQAELHFPKGPLKYFCGRYEFIENENQWSVLITLLYAPRGIGLLGYFVAKKILQQLSLAITTVDKNVRSDDFLAMEPYMEKSKPKGISSDSLAKKLSDITGYPNISKIISDFVLKAPEKFVSRMRPIEIATHFNLPTQDTISFFLRATRGGVFDLSWDILCPSCRGASSRTKNLSGLNNNAHCEMCLIDMTADLADNVELTFSPVHSVRKITGDLYCVFSPANTPHIHSQVNVWKGLPVAKRYFFEEQQYKISAIGTNKTRILATRQDGAKKVRIELPKDLDSDEPLLVNKDCVIEWILTDSEYPYTVKIGSHFKEKALMASHVTSMQEFRDLFSAEVLSANTQVKVSNLTFLFTDLKDSTPMYERMGDASAFALVRDHFSLLEDCIKGENGAIVKTIGDAVMAVFVDMNSAKKAAISIQKQIQIKFPNVQVKIGLHSGSSLAVNSNDKLDYFGTTVNKAARIQGLAEGGEIVMEESLDQDDLPIEEGFQRRVFQTELKGIKGNTNLVSWKLSK